MTEAVARFNEATEAPLASAVLKAAMAAALSAVVLAAEGKTGIGVLLGGLGAVVVCGSFK